MVNFNDIKENPVVRTYITAANDALGVIGFTEHGLAHATKVSGCAASVIEGYGGSEREVEGVLPFSLVVGNASHVKLTYKGRDVPLEPRSKDDVARVSLD